MYTQSMIDVKFDDMTGYAAPAAIEELNANEVELVDGGIAPLVILAVAAVVIVGAAFVAGVIDGASGQQRQ